MSEYEFSFTAGMLVRKNLRYMLESEKFSGRDIRWLEDKGFIESTFRVRGKDAKLTEQRIDHYIKILDSK